VNSNQARTARRTLDRRLRLLAPAERFQPPAKGWVRAIRESLGMSHADLGVRLGVTAASVSDMERSELERRVQLSTLARAADAMDCDLVYAFIPRHGLEETVQRAARAKLAIHVAAVSRSMELEDQAAPVDQEIVDDEIRRLIASGKVWK
jgi:predicted DNA-binding mobile mystery protein A